MPNLVYYFSKQKAQISQIPKIIYKLFLKFDHCPQILERNLDSKHLRIPLQFLRNSHRNVPFLNFNLIQKKIKIDSKITCRKSSKKFWNMNMKVERI